MCKVSGIVASAAPDPWTADDLAPIINHVLDTFGPDRVMFGGDWPVCTLAATYRQWVEALKAIVATRSAGRPAQAVPRQRGHVLWPFVESSDPPTPFARGEAGAHGDPRIDTERREKRDRSAPSHEAE